VNQVRYVLLVITVIGLVGVSALALDIPNTFAADTVISASEMNANFAAVEAGVLALEAMLPVVAHATSPGTVNVTNTEEHEDIVVVTIEAPTTGVVVVQATAQVAISGSLLANLLMLQIDRDAGGADLDDHVYTWGMINPPNVTQVLDAITIQRAFEVEAGVHTYRLEARAPFSGGQRQVGNATITATHYASARASVTTAGH
jgi:hypothetical protein